MADDKKPNFRVHFRVELVEGQPLQKKTYDAFADTPYGADCAVRRAHPGKRVFIDKIKKIKEDA